MTARLLAAAALALLAAPAAAQDVAITNATVALGDGSAPIQSAAVLVRGGRVVAAGAGVALPEGVPVIDGRGLWVTPGLFASITHLGLSDVDAVDESNDIDAGHSPFSAALDVEPAINPASQDIAISRAGGVTRASVTPEAGRTIFAGQGALIDLAAGQTAVLRPRAFQFAELGEEGARLAGGSRTSSFAMLRNALHEALLMQANPQRDTENLLNRVDAAALLAAARGEQPIYIRAERASDILAVLALRDEFSGHPLKLVIVGATEGWMVADAIAAAHVPVIAAALNDLPASFERLAATQSNIGRMVDAGVVVGIGGYESSGDHPRSLPQYAGNLVALTRVPGATGLSWGEALAAITAIPARIAGLTGGEGTLAPGAPGDLVLWDGDPLELSSAPVRVFIEGVEQPLDSHQTRLRDRYRVLDETVLPRGLVR